MATDYVTLVQTYDPNSTSRNMLEFNSAKYMNSYGHLIPANGHFKMHNREMFEKMLLKFNYQLHILLKTVTLQLYLTWS